MDTCLDPRGSREPGRVVVDIIDGRPWIASRIRNNNLRQHCRMLGRSFRTEDSVVRGIRPAARRLLAVIAERSGIFPALHPSDFPLIPAILRLAAYFIHWRRHPEDWQPDPGASAEGQWHTLLEHLFSAGHPLPAFFAKAWLIPGPLSHPERDWYCHAAAGKSLRHAPGMSSTLSSRALHHAMQAPKGFGIRQALRWGQLRAIGADEALIKEVLASRMTCDFARDEMWLPLLKKIVASKGFQPQGLGPLADMFLHELATEGLERTRRLLSIPLPDLQRRSRRLWNRLLKICRRDGAPFHSPAIWRPGVRAAMSVFIRRQWEPMPGSRDRETLGAQDAEWRIDQLTSHLQLMTEGDCMGNCVAWYWKKCWSGKSAIFSVREILPETGRAVSRITIEIDSATRRIVQIERRWNHRISALKTPVVKKWALRNGLVLA